MSHTSAVQTMKTTRMLYPLLAGVLMALSIPMLGASRARVAVAPTPTPVAVVDAGPPCSPASIKKSPESSPLWIERYATSNLSIEVTGSKPITIEWFTDDGTLVGSGPTIAVTPYVNTCYYAVVSNACQTVKTGYAWVMISTPEVTDDPTARPSTIAAGEKAVLEAGGGTGLGPFNFKWYTSDGTHIGSGKKLVVHPKVTTSYYYKLCNATESLPSAAVTVSVPESPR
jgi:hypothetical protein